MKPIAVWMVGFLLLFVGVACVGDGHAASGEEAHLSNAAPSVALTADPAVVFDPESAESTSFVQSIQIKAWDLLLTVVKGITWSVLALIGLYFCLVFLVLFVHITAWFLAQIMGRLAAVGLAVLLIVGCLSLIWY